MSHLQLILLFTLVSVFKYFQRLCCSISLRITIWNIEFIFVPMGSSEILSLLSLVELVRQNRNISLALHFLLVLVKIYQYYDIPSLTEIILSYQCSKFGHSFCNFVRCNCTKKYSMYSIKLFVQYVYTDSEHILCTLC